MESLGPMLRPAIADLFLRMRREWQEVESRLKTRGPETLPALEQQRFFAERLQGSSSKQTPGSISRCVSSHGMERRPSLRQTMRHYSFCLPFGGDKATNYADGHERVLSKLPLDGRILELGVFRGESMAAWADYFPCGLVVGIDFQILPFLNYLEILRMRGAFETSANIHFLQENYQGPGGNFVRKMKRYFGLFDAIIDDACHTPEVQIATFNQLVPLLYRRGGVYIIEDIAHDGLEYATRTIEYFAKVSRDAVLNSSQPVERVEFAQDVIRIEIRSGYRRSVIRVAGQVT